MCVQLEGDSPLVEEFELPLWLVVAGRGFWRGTALATTAQFAAASFASSPCLWWCSVLLSVFVCVRCLCGGGIGFGALCTSPESRPLI